MPLSEKQQAALAAGRAKRRQNQSAGETTRKRLKAIDDTIEEAGLDQPVRDKAPRPKAKVKAEQLVTPEASNLGAAALNWLIVRFFGEESGMTQAEAVSVMHPLMCMGARRMVKLLEKLAPQGTEGLKEGDPRDLMTSGLAFVKYATRRVAEAMQSAEQRRQQRKQLRDVPQYDTTGPIGPVSEPVATEEADNTDQAPARNGSAFAPPWVNIPRDMGQALYG